MTNDSPRASNQQPHLAGQDSRAINIGRDAAGNVLVTGDGNTISVTLVIADQRLASHLRRTADVPSENPYPGLDAFYEDNAEWFFGRQRLVDRAWLLLQTIRRGGGSQILAIVGASGSGKSSLVRAGLIPELARRPLRHLGSSSVLVMRPGRNPCQRLRETTVLLPGVNAGVEFPSDPGEGLSKEDALHRLLRNRAAPSRSAVVLVIDQFEELFTECEDAGNRERFLRCVEFAACAREEPVTVIITIRSDFVGACPLASVFGKAIREHRLPMTPMDRNDLFDAISRPAARLGHPWPAALVENLVAQAEGRMGALPLLQFALRRLWPEQVADTLDDSKWSSRLIEEFLVETAETLFTASERTEGNRGPTRQILRRAFLAMVQYGEGTSDTRRVVRLSEIVGVGETPEQVRQALASFAAPEVRLVTTAEINDEPTYELTHEALIASWDRLHAWLGNVPDRAESERIRADLRMHRKSLVTASEWKAGGAGLWRGTDLELFRRYATRVPDDLTAIQIEFLARSLRHSRMERWLAYTAVASLVALAVFAGVLAKSSRQREMEALEQRGEANRRAAEALAREAVSRRSGAEAAAWLQQTNPSFSTVSLALQAVQAGTSWCLQESTDWVGGSSSWSSEGRFMAYSPHDGPTLSIYDMRSGLYAAIARPDDTGSSNEFLGIACLSWSPAGSPVLAVGFDEGPLKLWRQGDKSLRSLPGYDGRGGEGLKFDGTRLTFGWSPDARELLSTGRDGHIRCWQVPLDAEPYLKFDRHTTGLFEGANDRTEWSPDASLVAVCTESHAVRIWERKTESWRTVLESPPGVTCMAWSPDSQHLAVGLANGTLVFWDRTAPDKFREYVAVPEAIPDDNDRIINYNLRPPDEAYWAAAAEFTQQDEADGRRRMMAYRTQAFARGKVPIELAWSKDGNMLAFTSTGSQLWLLDTVSGKLRLIGRARGALKWSSTDKIAAIVAQGTLGVWTIRRVDTWYAKSLLTSSADYFVSGEKEIMKFSWCPDGRAVFSESAYGHAEIWDTQTHVGGAIEGLDVERPHDLGWSHSGRFLAVSSWEGLEISVWDKNTGRIKKFPTNGSREAKVKWSPSADTLLLFSPDEKAILYDAVREVATALDGFPGSSESVRWMREGKNIIVFNPGNVFIYDSVARKVEHRYSLGSLPPVDEGGGRFDISPDEKSIVVNQSDATLLIYDLVAGKMETLRQSLPGKRRAAVVQLNWLDRNRIMVMDNFYGWEWWDLPTKKNLDLLENPRPGIISKIGGGVRLVAWSPHSRRLATGSHNVIRILDENLDLVRNVSAHTGEVGAIVWSPDGELLASGGGGERLQNGDSAIRITEVASGKTIAFERHTDGAWAAAWSPDQGVLASSSDDGTVRLWPFPRTAEQYNRFLANRTNLVGKSGVIERQPFSGLPWWRSREQ